MVSAHFKRPVRFLIIGGGRSVGYEAHLSHIFFEGVASFFRQAANGKWVLSFERFLDQHVFCVLQFCEVAATSSANPPAIQRLAVKCLPVMPN